MKLENLIDYLLSPERLTKLYEVQNLNVDSEAILIYMKDKLKLDAEVTLFPIEETEDDITFEKMGVKYIQLFPVDYAIDLIESDLNLKDKGYSNIEIATRLIEYRIKDA